MRPYILEETNWKAVKETKYDLAILPWGATEAHNYHLPYGTDSIQVSKISAESARIASSNGAKIIVLPTIPFGVNTGQTDIPLTMNINPSTQFIILKDIIQNLINSGIDKLMIVNGHGGNDFKQIIRELGVQFPNMFIGFTNWFQAFNRDDFFEEPGDHADEMETSILMHISPKLILPIDEAGNGDSKKFKVKALNESWVWTERKWTSVSSDTGIGNPKKSTKEKGEKFFIYITNKLSRLFVDLSKADIDNMYE